MITFQNWRIHCGGLLGRQFDNLSRRLDVAGELPEGWTWEMLARAKGAETVIPLELTENGAGADLTRDQLSVAGWYELQLRGSQGDLVRHTNIILALVSRSVAGEGKWPDAPSTQGGGITVTDDGEGNVALMSVPIGWSVGDDGEGNVVIGG